MTTRRRLVIALGAGALASPLSSFAQPAAKVWRVGFLATRHVDFVDADYYYGPFTQGMRELGYIVGKNLLIEWRSAEGKSERLPELAADLVQLKVDVLIGAGNLASLAAQKATTVIPIVVQGGDPVGTGLVKSLARPGGNITGFSNMLVDIVAKVVEMLHTMLPKVTRVAVLVNPTNPGLILGLNNVQIASQKLGVKIQPVEVNTAQDIVNAFSSIVRQKSGALLVLQDPFFIQQKKQIVELAAKHRLPSAALNSEYVEAGGLMSYGPNLRENFRSAATYVDKIFKGANPGELPVQQPTRFEMAVNMKTANALGIKVPQTILIQATRVIE